MEITKETQSRIRLWILNGSLEKFVSIAMVADVETLQTFAKADTKALEEIKGILQNYTYSGQRIINEMEKNNRLEYKDALLRLNVNELLRNIYVL